MGQILKNSPESAVLTKSFRCSSGRENRRYTISSLRWFRTVGIFVRKTSEKALGSCHRTYSTLQIPRRRDTLLSLPESSDSATAVCVRPCLSPPNVETDRGGALIRTSLTQVMLTQALRLNGLLRSNPPGSLQSTPRRRL